jgi:hypothetical protein
MSRGRKRRGVARFCQLHHRLLKSHAWHSLTPLQRCGYIEIAQLYDGTNNGRLAMSTRRLAGLIPCHRNSRILQELEDAGFIETVKAGRYTRAAETRTASEYRLTDFKCDVTSEFPSRRYNERHRWEPAELKPKRKALTSAERARRYRKRHAERHNECDGSGTMNVPVSVTVPKTPKTTSWKTAKNGGQKGPTVTTSVTSNVSHIHLTKGGGSKGTTPTAPRGQKGGQTHFGPNVTPLRSLPPGHDLCKLPKNNSLPPGWHWCKSEQRVVTDAGVVVPIVDDPLIGTEGSGKR